MRGRIILVRPFFFTRLPLGFGVFIPVAQAFRGEGSFAASGEDGVLNMRALDAAYKSWATGSREQP